MKRIEIEPRKNWQGIVESQGFNFHSNGLRPTGDTASNWFEAAAYEFTLDEINKIEAATIELYNMSMEAVKYVITNDLLDQLNIPMAYQQAVRDSWFRGYPAVYGRFDFALDNGTPKLLEFNADTPTTLIESAIIQWWWLKNVKPEYDQFNSIHEKLIDRWDEIYRMINPEIMYFSSIKNNMEEFSTVEYIRDTATQAGLQTKFIYIEDIGFLNGQMVDLENNPIKFWFKLYPWEWLAQEQFGGLLAGVLDDVGVIEPEWKMILSNKGILPILWKLFPNHPNLLAAYDNKHNLNSFVSKPVFGREGKNITLSSNGSILQANSGPYAEERMVYQGLASLPKIDGEYSIIGSWIINDKPAGMIIREDTDPIITAQSRIVPHYIKD